MDFRSIRLMDKDNQLVSAVILAFFLLSASIYLVRISYQNHGLIDFEDLPSRSAEFVVDINEADWPELANLPGIGEKLAKSIVDHRFQNGPFDSPEQLIEVDGIGQAKMNAVKPFVYTNE